MAAHQAIAVAEDLAERRVEHRPVLQSTKRSLLCQGRSALCGFSVGGDGGCGCWEEACRGVLWVGECGSRALEGLRSRRLASARASSVVIASSWGVRSWPPVSAALAADGAVGRTGGG